MVFTLRTHTCVWHLLTLRRVVRLGSDRLPRANATLCAVAAIQIDCYRFDLGIVCRFVIVSRRFVCVNRVTILIERVVSAVITCATDRRAVRCRLNEA